MSRKIVLALVWFLSLHTCAAAAGPFANGAHNTLEHLLVHARSIPHHHEQNGATHFDTSGSSGAHQLDFDADFHIYSLITPQPDQPGVRRCESEPAFYSSHVTYPVESPPLPPPRRRA